MRATLVAIACLIPFLSGSSVAGEPDEGATALELLREACPVCEGVDPGLRSRGAPVSAERDPGRPFAVKIHADWCMTCLMLDVVWQQLREREGGRARFLVLDVSDAAALDRSRAEADRVGVSRFLERHRGRSGTIGILHGASRVPTLILHGELDVERYAVALETARSAPAGKDHPPSGKDDPHVMGGERDPE